MIKATYLLISWNHGNIFLKPMQNFIIYFSHFSFSAISQACFHIRWKLVYYIIIPYHKPYFNLEKKCHGQIFKQLRNNSFICGVSHCKLVSYFVFKCGTFSNNQDWNMATESETFLNKHVPSASLLFEYETVPFHSRLNHAVQEVIY